MYMKQYMVNAGNISLVFTLTVPSSSMNNSLSAILILLLVIISTGDDSFNLHIYFTYFQLKTEMNL